MDLSIIYKNDTGLSCSVTSDAYYDIISEWATLPTLEYISWLEEKYKLKHKESNEFIKSIAELLKIDIDGVGFDGVQLTLDDFSEAIELLKNRHDE